MSEHTVGVRFDGDASGLASAVQTAVQNINNLQSTMQGFRASQGLDAIISQIKSVALPVTGAIAGAFATKKALEAYGKSNLPGHTEYTDAIKSAEKSVKSLAAAVGEYLAPTAIMFANIITKIADPLTTLVRHFTALSASSTDFLLKLGKNFATAFSTLIPTATAAVNYLTGLFSGPARDWMKDVQAFRQWWNATWYSILQYTAPIMVAAAKAIETALATVKSIATSVFDAISAGAANANGALAGLGEVVQQAFVSGFLVAEFVIGHWREVFEAGLVGAELALSKLGDAASYWFTQAIPAMVKNVPLYLDAIGPSFTALVGNIAATIKPFLDWMVDAFKVAFDSIGKLSVDMGISLVGTLSKYIHQVGYDVAHMNEHDDAQAGGTNTPQWRQYVAKREKWLDQYVGSAFATKPIDFKGVPTFGGIGKFVDLPKPDFSKIPGLPQQFTSDRTDSFQAQWDKITAMLFGEKQEAAAAGAGNFEIGEYQGTLTDALRNGIRDAFAKTPDFIASIMKGLPNVNAIPKPLEDAKASEKRTAAVTQGTTAAYTAILTATSGITNKQLEEARKANRMLGNIEKNTKAKPKKASVR